ncbi:hypothetical protein [Flavobacterium sp. JP2137]|uniref:hypothetical protein n=1 Tax=Flavobacterium sp. JP2137 TaxID=3414510 RepID=UPI003D2FE7DD
MSSSLKKTAYILGAILGLALVVHLGINFFIKRQLPQIIDARNDTAYDFKYGNLSFSIFNNSISIEDIEVTPKAGVSIKKDIDFLGKVDKISLIGVNFVDLIKRHHLKASTIAIIGPDITVFKPEQRDTIKTKSKLSSVIDISRISLKNAHLKIMSTDGQERLQELYNINMEIDGVYLGKYTQEKDIPFTYTHFKIRCDSVFSKLNEFQHIKTQAISVDPNHLDMDQFRIIPDIDRKTFKAARTSSNTRMDVVVPKLRLTGTDWGYIENKFFLKIQAINIDSINFKILDQKVQTVFQAAKKQAEHVIQPLIPFRVDIDSIHIEKSAFNSLNILDVQNVNIRISKISNRTMKHLSVAEVLLKNPIFTHYPKKGSNQPTQENRLGILDDVIEIASLKIEKAQYAMKDAQRIKNTLEVKDFNLSLDKIRIDDQTVQRKVPFIYQSPRLSTGKIHYNTGRFYDVYSNGIQVVDDHIELANIEMKPKYSRVQHVKMLKLADDIYTIRTKKIALQHFDWGFDARETFYLKAKKLVLNEVYANIFRNTTPPPDMSPSTMYSKKLRDLKFGLEVPQVQIVRAQIEYEEVDDKAIAPGKLTFSNFNAQIKNVYSGYGRKQTPNTEIVVDATFMKAAPVHVVWTFNIMNTRERFNIKGRITNFPALSMNAFLKPYVKASASGTIEVVTFDFSGNDDYAVGSFGMKYQDLKMTLYKKDGERKRKLLSAVGNMFIRNDTKGLTKETQIKQVERMKESSFFNYLWLCLLQGLKQTVL